METLTCLAHTPALRRTGVGSSPAMWNFLDNAKLHVEDPSLAGDDFDYWKRSNPRRTSRKQSRRRRRRRLKLLKRLKRLMTIRTRAAARVRLARVGGVHGEGRG